MSVKTHDFSRAILPYRQIRSYLPTQTYLCIDLDSYQGNPPWPQFSFYHLKWKKKKQCFHQENRVAGQNIHNYNAMQCYSTTLTAILIQGFVNPFYRYTFAQFLPSFLSPATLKNQSLLISVAALRAIEDKSGSFYS